MTAFTLRGAAGLPTEPASSDRYTLLVIDAQREYEAEGRLPLVGVDAALERIVQLLEHARAAGLPVVHVAHVGQPGAAFDPEEGGRISDRVKPAAGEPVVRKALPNAFAGTNLEDHLATDAHLLIAGFMTHMCVSATARAALDLGIPTTVVSDATATRDLPAADRAGAIEASSVHAAALAALADRFSVVTDTDTLLTLHASTG